MRAFIRQRQKAFTLVELMIAMTISLGIVAALATLLVNNSRAHDELERSSRQIENGRYAMELLTHELQLAGFLGELPQTGAVYVTTDPCATTLSGLGFDDVPFNVPVGIEGFQGTSVDPAPTCALDHKTDTAALVVRRLDTNTTAVASVAANNAYMQTSRCASDPAGTRFVLSDTAADFTLRNLACTGQQAVRRYITRIYYVASCDVCGSDTIPTLKRVEFVNGAMSITPLAHGVEELELEYGFDTDADGAPDVYLTGLSGTASAADDDWSNVMAVRVWLVSRATDPTPAYTDDKEYHLGLAGDFGPYNDAFKRRAYSQLVRLNNPAGLRE